MPLDALDGFFPKQPSGAVASYNIAKSLRFNAADSAYLARTPGGAGTRTTCTLSMWVKRGNLGITAALFGCGTSSSDTDYLSLIFNSSDQIAISGGTTTWRITSQVFRDPAAWYHIMVVIDTGNATANDRVRLYVNGSRITSFGTTNNPSLSANMGWGQAAQHMIGCHGATTNFFDGLIADVYFLDGTAVSSTSTFGEFNVSSDQWVAKQPTGLVFGTVGCWLSFYNSASTTTIGYDDAGGVAGAHAGSNNWTANNLSVTAGVGNDSLSDTPQVSFCTLNPLDTVSGFTLANGLLQFTATGSIAMRSTWALPSGKWYWEFVQTATGGNNSGVGIMTDTATKSGYLGSDANGWVYAAADGKVYNNGVGGTANSTWTTNDVISVAVDTAAGTCTWYKNGVSQANGATGLSGKTIFPAVGGNSMTSCVGYLNFGQRAFAYTPPAGYNALSTANLATPAISKSNTQFDVEAFTGTGATRSKTGLAFQPDLVWFKGRGAATDHAIYDSVRGVQKDLGSNLVTAETTQSTGLTAFNSDGYTTGNLAKLNTSAATYVAWLMKKGVTPGFDVVGYAGNNTLRTISHALGQTPAFMIVKRRTTANSNWAVWHRNLTSAAYWMQINTTNAQSSDTTLWNSTAPTSSVFTVNTASEVNLSSNDYIAYLWAAVDGFSRFGSYAGNGSAGGPFVWCGFRPKLVLIKRIDTTGDWQIWDTSRSPYNLANATVAPNLSSAESAFTSGYDVDLLSNGFKWRASSAVGNASGGIFIFVAFAEFPFKYANAR